MQTGRLFEFLYPNGLTSWSPYPTLWSLVCSLSDKADLDISWGCSVKAVLGSSGPFEVAARTQRSLPGVPSSASLTGSSHRAYGQRPNVGRRSRRPLRQLARSDASRSRCSRLRSPLPAEIRLCVHFSFTSSRCQRRSVCGLTTNEDHRTQGRCPAHRGHEQPVATAKTRTATARLGPSAGGEAPRLRRRLVDL
jgi:hypothetical protein